MALRPSLGVLQAALAGPAWPRLGSPVPPTGPSDMEPRSSRRARPSRAAITKEGPQSPDPPLKSNFVSRALKCLKEALNEGGEGPLRTSGRFLMASQRARCRLCRLTSAHRTQLLDERGHDFGVMADSAPLCRSSGQRSSPAGGLLSHLRVYQAEANAERPLAPTWPISACGPSGGASHSA